MAWQKSLKMSFHTVRQLRPTASSNLTTRPASNRMTPRFYQGYFLLPLVLQLPTLVS
jgi:hypothetical protein